MRPIVLPYSGPTSAIPLDVRLVNSIVNITISGTGTLQATNDSPWDATTPPFLWNTISPGLLNTPWQALRMASGAGVLTVVQQGGI